MKKALHRIVNTATGRIDFAPTQLDRSVIVPDQMRKVLTAYKDSIYTDLFPDRDEIWEYIPKTLIFAKDDNHATEIVNVVKEVFADKFKNGVAPDKFVQKITYSAGDSNALIRDLRTDKEFRIAVTVTLVATGTDVKPLEVVLFMNDVKSDVLYTQMKGRGCRVINEDKLREITPNANTKECFYIVDAVGVTEHDKTIPKPKEPGGEQKPKVPTLERLLEYLSHGEVSDDNAEELQHLFEVVKGTKLELPVLVAAFYGLRRGEVCGLKWDAIDFERGTITIRHTVTSLQVDGKTKMYAQDSAKTKSSMRTLPLVGSFAEYFKEAKAAQEVNKKVCGNCYNYEYDGYVFVDELGDLMRPEYLTSYFPQYIQKHGCKRMRFHDLRHSCASLLLANGVPLKQIQEWLGHSDFSTTANIYAHLDYTSKLSSAKAMVSGMALPESVNFGSKWAEISADDGKN